MPVPIPAEDILRDPPSHDEVVVTARAHVTAIAGDAGLREIQRNILHANIRALTGVEIDLDTLEPIGPAEFAVALSRRDRAFRVRQVQTMLLAALVVDPLPEEIGRAHV